MNKKQEEQIRELARLRTQAYISVLADMAHSIILDEVKTSLKASGRSGKLNNAASKTPEEITRAVLDKYLWNLNKGGSTCVERRVTDNGNGTFTFTTEERFVPWLDDMTNNTANEIIKLIGDSESAGVYPLDIAKSLKEYMEGTSHNAVTAARTEAQKIRSDARFSTFSEQGVKYVQYVTVGDSAVRPEHAARDGKIYKIEDAPYLGEYNCRCTVTPADYKVKMQNAPVEPNDAITLPGRITQEKKAIIPEVPKTPQQQRIVKKTEEEARERKLWQPFTAEEMDKIQTEDELKKEMKSRWSIDSLFFLGDFSKIDFKLMKDNVLSADRMMTDLKFENLISQMKTHTNPELYMACGPGEFGSTITWYKELMGSAKRAAESYARDVATGWHPKGTTSASIFTHELGHAAEWRLVQMAEPTDIDAAIELWDKHTIAKDIVNEALKEYKATTGIKGRKWDIIDTALAKYPARAKIKDQRESEALAEAFAEYYTMGENARDLSKIIINLTKKKIEEIRR